MCCFQCFKYDFLLFFVTYDNKMEYVCLLNGWTARAIRTHHLWSFFTVFLTRLRQNDEQKT